jgi:DNA-binding NarL/FixJ family response regulator
MKKKILLVDDHPLLRQGIGQLINQQEDLVTCGEAEDRASAMIAIEQVRPDLAVVDLSLKEDRGLELIRDCRDQFPELLMLVLSMHDERFYAERVLRAGARGYIMKREASDKVLEAIRCVLGGEVFVSSRVAGSILNKVAGHTEPAVRSPWERLSDREMDIFTHIGKGYGSQQIAKRLNISVKTVETHRANIKLKLKVTSGDELLQQAIGCASQLGEL